MGTIKLKLYTITKNFEKYGVETWFWLDEPSNESKATNSTKLKNFFPIFVDQTLC